MDCWLYNENSLTTKVDLSQIDAVITDPPYGCNYSTGDKASPSSLSSKAHREGSSGFSGKSLVLGDHKEFDPSPWLGFPRVAFTRCQWFYDKLPRGGMIHIWNKRGRFAPIDQGDADLIWISEPQSSSKVPRLLNLVWRGLNRQPGLEDSQSYLHPTQKPVALMEWIIKLLFLPKGSLVLDPYMGSGSTGVACANLGMKFIGFESKKEHFVDARARVEFAYNGPNYQPVTRPKLDWFYAGGKRKA